MKFEEITFFFAGLEEKLAGAFRFELKTSVLETDILSIETTRLCNLRFVISFNRKSQIFGVSDGTRTRNIWFGRPTLSRIEFRSLEI